MKKILPLIAIVIIGGLLTFLLIPKNQVAPSFQLTDLQGKIINNQHLQGKVSFINFWFPSCPGCVSEMPKIIKMAQDYQGKDLQILGIAEPVDPLTSVQNYVQTRGITFTVMYDTNSTVGKAFGTVAYPTSFLINKKGEVVKTFLGEPDFAQLYQQIDAELAK